MSDNLNQGAPPDVHVRDLPARWNCHRNTINNRAQLLGVDLIREGYHDRYWPGEWLALGDQLAEWVAQGNNAQAFVQQMKAGVAQSNSQAIQQSDSRPVRRESNSGSIVQQSADCRIQPANDPREMMLRWEWALERKVPMSLEVAAWVIGKTEAETLQLKMPHRVAPGLRLHKVVGCRKDEHFYNLRQVVKREEPKAPSQFSAPAAITHQHPGERMLAAIDVEFRDLTGSDLFNTNRIVG